MSGLIPDPIKSYKPRVNDKPQQESYVEDTAISPTTLAVLGSMSKEELVVLVGRMARQCGLVANMSKEETVQAMLDVLAHTALRDISPGINMRADIQSRIAAIDKWLDRERGKPAQYIEEKKTIDMNVRARREIQALDKDGLREIRNILNNSVIDADYEDITQ